MTNKQEILIEQPEKESEILERERKRELNELSEKAVEIFEKIFSSPTKYLEFDEEKAKETAKKWNFTEIGIDKIRRVIDYICYQIGDTEEELKNAKFELGILDPNYQTKEKFGGIHDKINFYIKKVLNAKINWNITDTLKGILCENSQGLRYLICGKDEGLRYLTKRKLIGDLASDKLFSEKLKEMLKRYNIAELFLGNVEHNKEINKRVLNDQLSVGSKKAKDAYFEELKKQRTGD